MKQRALTAEVSARCAFQK